MPQPIKHHIVHQVSLGRHRGIMWYRTVRLWDVAQCVTLLMCIAHDLANDSIMFKPPLITPFPKTYFMHECMLNVSDSFQI